MIYNPHNILQDPAALEELQRVAQAIEWLQSNPALPQRKAEYPRPFDGQMAVADGVNWDPLGDGVKRPVWYDKATGQWFNFGEGAEGGLVHAVLGTPNQIVVNNSDPNLPVLSLHATVLNLLALAGTAVQPANSANIRYTVQSVADKSWFDNEFVRGTNIIGVRTAGAIVRLPIDLSVEKLVYVKNETGGSVTVVPYDPTP